MWSLWTSRFCQHSRNGIATFFALEVQQKRDKVDQNTPQESVQLHIMAADIYPPYPPNLTHPEEEYLLSNLKDWSIAHGLAVRPAESFVAKETDPAGALATTAPVTLFPSLFPRRCFEQAKAVSKAYNELYSAIASDEEWLKGTVEE